MKARAERTRRAPAAKGAPERALYYQRVAPVVGEALRGRTVRARGVAGLSRAIEALGRTGVTELSVPPPEAEMGAALRDALAAHNRWERYRVEAAEAPRGGRADLVLATGGPGRAGAAALAEARRLGAPAVIGWLLEGCSAASARLVWLPELDDVETRELVDRRVAELDAAPAGDARVRFLDWLDLNGLCLSAAASVLLRGSARARPELEEMWTRDRRLVLLHGSVRWPWEVRYPPLAHPLPLTAEPVAAPVRPALMARVRLLLLGCGTGSLFAGEAVRFFRNLVLVDSKAFSAYNPVRQLAGTDHVGGKLKPYALQDVLAERIAAEGAWEDEVDGPITWRRSAGWAIGAAELHLRETPAAMARFEELLDAARPDVVVVAMGRSRDDNFTACAALRKRGIRHVVPTAFPAVTHYKHIVVDGAEGPCYECLQNRLPVDAGPVPQLTESERELFYGGTQPATLAETYPSAFSLLRLVVELALPRVVRAPWFQERLSMGSTCFVGANRAMLAPGEQGDWLYGVGLPHQMVTYGVREARAAVAGGRCRACGRALAGEA